MQAARDLALEIAGHAAEKKAQDIVVLEMGGVVTYTDFFVIATGGTPRQTKAIVEEIQSKLRSRRRPLRVEGEREGDWILLDYLDVVVHIFTPGAREFYRLEHLWGDVPQFAVGALG